MASALARAEVAEAKAEAAEAKAEAAGNRAYFEVGPKQFKQIYLSTAAWD